MLPHKKGCDIDGIRNGRLKLIILNSQQRLVRRDQQRAHRIVEGKIDCFSALLEHIISDEYGKSFARFSGCEVKRSERCSVISAFTCSSIRSLIVNGRRAGEVAG